MRVHSLDKIEKIKELRGEGKSIINIMSELSLPKSTVWHHIQGIKLSEIQKNILKSNQGGSKIRRLKNEQEANNYAKQLLKGKNREYVLLLAMLYWAEGHKRHTCAFTNSDGKMVQVYLLIIRKILGIKDENIHVTVRVFTNTKTELIKSMMYWQNITNINYKKFTLRINDGGTRGRTEYGMCRITILKGNKSLKLMHSLIKLISDEILSMG